MAVGLEEFQGLVVQQVVGDVFDIRRMEGHIVRNLALRRGVESRVIYVHIW